MSHYTRDASCCGPGSWVGAVQQPPFGYGGRSDRDQGRARLQHSTAGTVVRSGGQCGAAGPAPTPWGGLDPGTCPARRRARRAVVPGAGSSWVGSAGLAVSATRRVLTPSRCCPWCGRGRDVSQKSAAPAASGHGPARQSRRRSGHVPGSRCASTSLTSRRPWLSATTPQVGQPIGPGGDSTRTRRCSPTAATSRTCRPRGRPGGRSCRSTRT